MQTTSWIIENLQTALDTWNRKMAEIWQLLTQSPQDFKSGGIWEVIVDIHGAIMAIGLGVARAGLCHDSHRIRQILQALPLRRDCADFPEHLRGRADIEYRAQLREKLCGGLSGGRNHRARMHHLFALRLRAARHGRERLAAGANVGLCRGNHLQYAHPRRLRKNGRPGGA